MRKFFIVFFFLSFVLSFQPLFAQAEEEYEDELILPKEESLVNVIQKKKYLKRHKLEITPKGGMVVNDNYIRITSGGAGFSFYLNDYWAIELEGMYINSQESSFVDYLRKKSFCNDAKKTYCVSIYPEYNKEKYSAAGGIQWCPLYGKMSFLAGYIVPYDMYLFLRGGIIGTETGALPMINPGIGQRYFIHRFFILRFDINFNLFQDKIQKKSELGGAVQAGAFDKKFKPDMGLFLGLSFFLPTFNVY